MEDLSFLLPAGQSLTAAKQEAERCMPMLRKFGLTLTEQELGTLAERRAQALRSTGRVEFGGSALPALIRGFCDSPYLQRDTCAETLGSLQELFYQLKNLTEDGLTDEELVRAMRTLYDGRAGGSVEYLEGVTAEELRRAAEGQPANTLPETEEDADEE
ncbi:MAG: DUF6323 family protein [Oscillibacter sp.]|jgi:hypothetical protein|nr:DUF6323 family protein [Oscillibacter sp.]